MYEISNEEKIILRFRQIRNHKKYFMIQEDMVCKTVMVRIPLWYWQWRINVGKEWKINKNYDGHIIKNLDCFLKFIFNHTYNASPLKFLRKKVSWKDNILKDDPCRIREGFWVERNEKQRDPQSCNCSIRNVDKSGLGLGSQGKR